MPDEAKAFFERTFADRPEQSFAILKSPEATKEMAMTLSGMVVEAGYEWRAVTYFTVPKELWAQQRAALSGVDPGGMLTLTPPPARPKTVRVDVGNGVRIDGQKVLMRDFEKALRKRLDPKGRDSIIIATPLYVDTATIQLVTEIAKTMPANRVNVMILPEEGN